MKILGSPKEEGKKRRRRKRRKKKKKRRTIRARKFSMIYIFIVK